ncbi:MAG: carbamoyltransferase HypF, partial [Methylococcales bacterium]|nr:carbamoyltransferase HypF [Methylococcales bacterium]
AERSSVFHASLAGAITTQAKAIREKYNITSIGLSGGVFQNRLLTEQALSGLEKLGFDVYLHKEIPCGDGGISFGQIIEGGGNR